MKTETFRLAAGEDAALHVRHAAPAGEAPIGVVCLVHGMGEHSGRYGHVMEALAAAGFAVFALDQRGHGLSPGKRGHADSVARLAGDAALLIDRARAVYPDAPVFLYGHSMGGNVALSCALRLRPPIAGLVLSSPWLRLAFEPPAYKVTIGRALGSLWPTLTMRTGLNGGALYRNEAFARRDLEDELLHNRISASMYFSLTDEGERSLRDAEQLQTPLLLLHGTSDRVTSYEASRELAERLAGRCEFVTCEDGCHELHNDIGCERIIARVTSWLQARASGTS